ncbi:MAG TPA: NAD(P)H-binding protein [Anaerolineae bacterium]|nr:NAD(P)H-binding protein [Anaerolineae bacterium]
MGTSELNVVTGAFGYTGKYVARRLLSMGKRVKTLTTHPDRPSPFGDRVSVAPFDFDRPEALIESLRGAAALYNTYWVRFDYGSATFEAAVENTKTLFRAAKEAGVRRVVHVSVSNPSEDSPLSYFRGKALLEKALVESGLSHAIVRPTVTFGDEDILINNIAWLLRRFPVFAILGEGDYRVQPIFVEDVAELMVSAGSQSGNLVVDAAGPEVYTFDTLVRTIKSAVRSRARIVHLPPRLALFLSQVIGVFVGDVVLTQEEVDGLMAGLLVSSGPPTGRTHLSEWLREHAHTVGAKYASEVTRHFRS